MPDQANGNETELAPALATAAIPALAIADIEHWGVSPDGMDAVLIVRTVTGTRARLVMGVGVLNDLLSTVRIAAATARQNQANTNNGDQLVAADKLDGFSVGHMSGQSGVLMVINPDKPDQHAYGMDSTTAMRLGAMLKTEGTARAQVEGRIESAVRPQGKRRLIMPRGFNGGRQ